ncbi:condensation domain-containing protein, partial [Streptomyces sp. 12257]
MSEAHLLRRPVSAAQSGIWVAQHLHADSPLYNCGGYYEISGPLDTAVLAEAVRRGVEETEALRSHFVQDEQDTSSGREVSLHQLVEPTGPDPLRLLDLRATADPEAAAHRWMNDRMARPFDLDRGPLSEQALITLADERHWYFHGYHHAVLDGFGHSVYAARVAALYTALLAGEDPARTGFAPLDRVVADEAAYTGSRRHAQDRAYWRGVFTDLPDPVSLAGRPATGTHSVRRHVHTLPAPLARGLADTAARLGVQWPALALAATAAFFHRMTGRTDFTFSLPLAGRTGRTSLTTPSAMVNVLPLRVTTTPDTPFADLASQVSRSLADVIRHQRFRGEELIHELGLSGAGQTRLGPTVNIMAFANEPHFGPTPSVAHPLSTGPVNDVKINFYGTADSRAGVRIEFDAHPDLYSEPELASHMSRLVRVLEWVVGSGGGSRVSEVEVLGAGERELVLSGWQGVSREVRGVLLPELFAEQVGRSAGAVAVVCGERSLTYGELDAWSDRVAGWLRSRGVGRGAFVAVMLPRSVELVVALLAVVKAGGAYVPVDPEYPAERVAHILGDARPVLVIDDMAMLDLPDAEPFEGVRVSPRDPVYVIYTSGSTGRPKGVVVEHVSVGAYLERAREVYEDAAGVAVLHSSVAFDLTVTALYTPLVSGGRVVLAELDEHAAAAGGPSFM